MVYSGPLDILFLGNAFGMFTSLMASFCFFLLIFLLVLILSFIKMIFKSISVSYLKIFLNKVGKNVVLYVLNS